MHSFDHIPENLPLDSSEAVNRVNAPIALLDEVLRLLASSDIPTLAELIEKQRLAMGLSVKAASDMLRMPRSSYERLTTGSLQKLDVATAFKLAHFLEIKAEEVLQLFAASSMPPEEFREVEAVKEEAFIRRNFDVAGLRKIGFVESTEYAHVKARIIEYFGLRSLYEYGTDATAILYNRSKLRIEDKMRQAWIVSAVKQFERINNPNPYDEAGVERLVTQIRPYTRQEKTGLLTVLRALYQAGVTVITQKALPNTAVHGATFIVHRKPCIVLTDHFQKYPEVWFTLLHELAHVILDRAMLDACSYHLSDGVGDLLLVESRADRFAYDLLLPQKKFEYIQTYINIESFVASYAAQQGVHPSIIYWRYAKERSRDHQDTTGWKFFGRFIPKPDVFGPDFWAAPWLKGGTVEQAATDAQQRLAAPLPIRSI
ncbi:MAG: ImmA/IrrE family metallo-endopeptidase [Hymenobacteraceae bacterium]|nr:ImmA/IrrE family metallo-endopeptidase [Hymenobacteraceae bacterium]